MLFCIVIYIFVDYQKIMFRSLFTLRRFFGCTLPLIQLKYTPSPMNGSKF